MPMRIRKTTKKAVSRMWREWLAVDIKAYGEKRGREIYKESRERKKKITLGAFDGKKLLGYASGEYSRGIAHLASLFVAENARGGGIGEKLVKAYETRAKRLGAHTLTVNTTGPLKNLGFYRKLGFKTESRYCNKRNKIEFIRLYKYT